MLDYKEIQKDFPILSSKMNGKPLVFLDSAASSQKPARVIDAFGDYYRCRNANIHRGAYRLSYEATDLFNKTRMRVAKFINAPQLESCLFTRNATESINLVANSYGSQNVSKGDEIVVSELEHHSNLVPWMILCNKTGATLKYIPLTKDSRLDLEQIDKIITKKTKIVSVAHMSNAIGTIHDIHTLAKKAHDAGAIFVVDGAQGACHLKVDVQDIDCDFYAISAHKMLGPTGVGVLYGKKELLEKMPPYMGGGDMILSVSRDGFKPAELPMKFEAGTPNIAGVVSFALALDYLVSIGLDNIHEHEIALTEYALEELGKLPGIHLYGPADTQDRGGIVSFNLGDIHSHDVGSILDEEGIAIRAGHHCCQPWMQKNDLAGTARASFYLYNGPEDVDALVSGLKKVQKIFG